MTYNVEEVIYEGAIVGGLTFGIEMVVKKFVTPKNAEIRGFLSVVGAVATKKYLMDKGYIKPIG